MTQLTHQEERMRLQLQLAQQKEYLDITDVSLLSGYSVQTIRRRAKEGRLKYLQNIPNGKLLFSKSSIQEWLEGGSK